MLAIRFFLQAFSDLARRRPLLLTIGNLPGFQFWLRRKWAVLRCKWAVSWLFRLVGRLVQSFRWLLGTVSLLLRALGCILAAVARFVAWQLRAVGGVSFILFCPGCIIVRSRGRAAGMRGRVAGTSWSWPLAGRILRARIRSPGRRLSGRSFARAFGFFLRFIFGFVLVNRLSSDQSGNKQECKCSRKPTRFRDLHFIICAN